MKDRRIMVTFSEADFHDAKEYCRGYDAVVAPVSLKEVIESAGAEYIELRSLVRSGSIYDAAKLAEELSRLTLPDGSRVSKSFLYEGYELWWTNYQNLYSRFCLPFTQYRELLAYVREYKEVHFIEPPFFGLFRCYLTAHGCSVKCVDGSKKERTKILPFGMFVQIILTFFSVPVLFVTQRPVLVSTGEKFEPGKDADFRMRYIYEELRAKKIPFRESIRSLDSTKTILEHAFVRRRAVIYSEAIIFVARFLSVFTGGHRRAARRYGGGTYQDVRDSEYRFKLLIATQYLLTVYDDVIAISIWKWLLRIVGVRAAIVPVTTERNYPLVLGCKLCAIPTVGILHGAASRYYNLYEFTPEFEGQKRISVDRYGVWSEWWKEYFLAYSKAYGPEQIFVSGLMRPIEKRTSETTKRQQNVTEKIRVLLVSEVVAVPEEVMPYLDALLGTTQFEVFIKFRATHDSFELWLKKHRPDIFDTLGAEHLLKGTMYEAIEKCDITVGCQSTGVVESVLQGKSFVYFKTEKWGDYFDMGSFEGGRYKLFAENPEELILHIREGQHTPKHVIDEIRKKFFGDPQQNGSAWVVHEVEALITAQLEKTHTERVREASSFR